LNTNKSFTKWQGKQNRNHKNKDWNWNTTNKKGQPVMF
jgi:hypothetical protein